MVVPYSVDCPAAEISHPRVVDLLNLKLFKAGTNVYSFTNAKSIQKVKSDNSGSGDDNNDGGGSGKADSDGYGGADSSGCGGANGDGGGKVSVVVTLPVWCSSVSGCDRGRGGGSDDGSGDEACGGGGDASGRGSCGSSDGW
ncbi:hypothetical protein E2542_SST15746 [Spatholobus suberectus]|nr:hypothetical protein E2542_SST15746 [Spatholobus suberectus]